MPPTSLTAFESDLASKFPDALSVRADFLIDQNSTSTPTTDATSSQTRTIPVISTANTVAVNDIILYNSSGNVKKVQSTTTSQSFALDTAVKYGDNTQKNDIDFDPNTDQYILMYRDRTTEGLRSHLISVATDGTMTISADFEVYSGNNFYPYGIYHRNAQRLIIYWAISGTPANMNYSIGTIIGNTISWTTPATQDIGGGELQVSQRNVVVEIPNTNYYVHTCASMNTGRACFATLWEFSSGSNVVEHDYQRVNSTASNQGRHYTDSLMYIPYGGNHYIVTAAFENGDGNRGTSYIIKVDLDTNSLVCDQVQYEYDGLATVNHVSSVYDPSSSCFVIVYRDNGNASQGHYVVGELTGSATAPSISFGSRGTFQNAIGVPRLLFNKSTNQVMCTYIDVTDNSYCKTITGTVDASSKTVAWDTPDTVTTVASEYPTLGFNDNENTFIIGYEEVTTNESYVRQLQFAGSTTTTNALQWVGMAKSTSPNVELYRQGDVVSALSLTQGQPVYVNYDGTLTQTPNEGEYLGTYGQIGYALTSSKMVITQGSRNG